LAGEQPSVHWPAVDDYTKDRRIWRLVKAS
jgi:hypothetical protein